MRGSITHLSMAHFLRATKLFLSSSAKLFKDDKLLCSNSFNSFSSMSSRDAISRDNERGKISKRKLLLRSKKTKGQKEVHDKRISTTGKR